MKKLAIVLIIVGVLLAILIVAGWYVDRTARQMAESEASKRILEVLPGTGKAEVTIESFPFLLGVLWSGSVDRLNVELTDVNQAGLEVEKITLVVDELRIDKDLLMDEKKLAVTGIARAEVVGRVTAEAVSKVVGEKVILDGNKAQVVARGMKVDAKFEVKKRRVTVSLSSKDVPAEIAKQYLGKPLVFALPGEEVLPCEPGLAVVDSRLELRCSVTELPASVKRALGQR
jgi:hypothetical protein